MDRVIEKYTYRIEWSEEDMIYIGRCLEFPGLAAHGDTNEAALKEIKTVVNESVKWLQDEQKSIPEPIGMKKFKGNLTLRVPPELHRKLAIKSAEEGVSINQYILSRI
ncbi:MAG: toxin-antitoxin system HicB family antitoxin [Candidatus Aminicenantes bacterium]|nr:toxin-antitoxin system HicB family antitoxin [Candidatus Aminicenantes bacterium]